MVSFLSKSAVARMVSPRRFRTLWALGAAVGAAWMGGCGPEGSPVEGLEVGEVAREIVGGTNAAITDVPWQVSLQNASGSHFCGGSILGANYILTAYHCVNQRNPADLRVAVGGSKRSTLAATGQVRQVMDVILHPGFSYSTLDKDVALVRVASPLTLNTTTVKGIPMATAADETAGRTNAGVISTVSGWGTLVPGASTIPDDLQKVDVPIIANADVPASYGPLTASMLAAGLTAGGKDSCQGDSGGPLVVNGAFGKILAGIVSWGWSCGQPNNPGIYTRVASIEPWVTNIRNRPVNHRLAEVLSVPAGAEWAHYPVTIAAGTTSLNAQLLGGTGEADLYVHGSAPTTSTYTCRSVRSGNAEYCSVPSPAVGTWYVSVRSVSGVSSTALRVTTY